MTRATNESVQELLDDLDFESWLDTEGVEYKVTHGRSGTQLNVKCCPVCGSSGWKVYLGADTGLGNCLAGETEILTREFGAVAIEHVSGQTVTLLDGNGEWVSCAIVDHGLQTTYAAKFTSLSGSTIVRSTVDHGWIAPDGSVVLTGELRRKKDRTSQIADLRWGRRVVDQEDHDRGVMHGLVYGDGSKEEFGNYRIRICSHHDSLAPFFQRFKSSIIRSTDREDSRFYIPKRDAWVELKQLPDATSCSLDYLLGFLRGWFAADGCVDVKGVCSLCCGVDEVRWLRQWAPVVGWRPRAHSALVKITNFGPRKKDSGNLFFAASSMVAGDFLVAQHRQRWSDFNESWAPTEHRWSFADTAEGKTKPFAPKVERVYCPVVPTTHSFALAIGLHSRNCFAGDHPPGENFNKYKFIRAHLGTGSARETIGVIEAFVRGSVWRPKRAASAPPPKPEHPPELPLSLPLPIKGRNLKYLIERDIDLATAEAFGLRYCHAGRFHYTWQGKPQWQDYSQRIIIPVFALDGTLVGFQGRDITGTKDRKYLFPPMFASTGQLLYNAHAARGASRIVVGEGAFDVMAIAQALRGDATLGDMVPVGTFGKNLSSRVEGDDQIAQLIELRRLGLKEVVMMWDAEPSALTAAIDAGNAIRRLGLVARIATLPAGCDPNEVPHEVVKAAISAAAVLTPMTEVSLRMSIRRMVASSAT